MISSYYIRGEACNLDDGRGIAEDDGPRTSLEAEDDGPHEDRATTTTKTLFQLVCKVNIHDVEN
tara:strand:+ start:804 stop:995 length:192 start_codon:yes stop_codon:yes gene_type:complete